MTLKDAGSGAALASPQDLRIAFVTFSDYPWRSGGVNQLIHSLAAALVRRGNDVRVYALPNFTGQSSPTLAAEADGVVVRPVEAPLLSLRSIPVLGPLGVKRSLEQWPRKVAKLLVDDKIDVVVADFTNASAAVALEQDRGGPPSVILRWANWAPELAQSGRVMRLFSKHFKNTEDKVLANAPCISPNGRDIEADLLARGVDAARIRFIPSAVDTARFSADYDVADLREKHTLGRSVVLFPSMLRDIKGFDHLLRAFALLPPLLRDGVSVVATGRGDAEPYRALATELGIAESIVFLGEVSDEDLPRWFALSDMAIFPYLFGAGTSVASIEALAAGLPVVAYRMQAFQYVIDDRVTGLLVEMGDIEGLSRAIRELLEDPSLRERISQAARRAADRYEIESVAAELEGVLRARLEGGSCA